jgi:outer membrane protein assembly factor BamE (lipoprotein component of BamABCDE complex)
MRWTQMKAGMTTDDVVALLGKPTRISSDVFVDYWTYGEGRTTGRVAFIRLSRMTIAWDPPVD